MKIATWNIERLKHHSKLPVIAEICEQMAADIFVFTEADTRLSLQYKTYACTLSLTNASFYRATERRVSLFTNYDLVRQLDTFDNATAVCVELMTERGALIVYGVVIGIYGNRHENFKTDFPRIIADIDRITADGKPVCILGDFNCSFTDSYYFTKGGRTALEEMFLRNGLKLLTRNKLECIDHIAISQGFVGESAISVEEWNLDKKLSDHKGIMVTMMQ